LEAGKGYTGGGERLLEKMWGWTGGGGVRKSAVEVFGTGKEKRQG